MSKSILLSIRPQWVVKILNGEKTVEVRKHDIPVGTKVYMYCTKDYRKVPYDYNSKVVASFVVSKCDKYSLDMPIYDQHSIYKIFYGRYEYIGEAESCKLPLLDKSCLSGKQLVNYVYNDSNSTFFAWHISQLEIFDKPKELGEFRRKKLCKNCFRKCVPYLDYVFKPNCCYHTLTKAPQSYCYVEELK